MLKVGDKAPAVTGTSYDGTAFDLGAPARRTVLFFYSKANTGLNDRSREFNAC